MSAACEDAKELSNTEKVQLLPEGFRVKCCKCILRCAGASGEFALVQCSCFPWRSSKPDLIMLLLICASSDGSWGITWSNWT